MVAFSIGNGEVGWASRSMDRVEAKGTADREMQEFAGPAAATATETVGVKGKQN